jgi:hypothetical protein
MAEQQEQDQPQRRRSFDDVLKDALTQWTKRFERALEEQREVLSREAQERTADMDRITLEHLGALEESVAARSAELEQMARQHKAAFDDAVSGRSREIDSVGSTQTDAIVKVAADAFEELEERAASQVQRIEEDTRAIRDDVRRSVAEGTTEFEKFAQKRLGELEDALRAKLEGFRRELVDETHRFRDASAEQLNETRSLVTAETRRLEEQAEGTRGEIQRVAGEEATGFDKRARERVAELQDALRSQTELLAEFTRMHGATSDKLEEARAYTAETMDRLSKIDAAATRQIQANEESAAAGAETLKRASATELNSIQQRAMALDELARKHIADVERQVGKLLEAETSTAEGLQEFERQMEGRRAEIETLLENRTAALTQNVQQAEAAVVRRIRELGERAADNAHAFDTRLGEATIERSKELDAFAEHVMRSLDERIAQAVEEASVASASDPRMTKLVEMIAASQVALDQVAERIDALEAIAAAPRPTDERRRDNGPAPWEENGRAATAPAPSPAPVRAIDSGASRGPTRDAPRSTPDLRGDD